MYDKTKICDKCDSRLLIIGKVYCEQYDRYCDPDFSCNSFVSRKAMNAKRATLVMHTKHVRT